MSSRTLLKELKPSDLPRITRTEKGFVAEVTIPDAAKAIQKGIGAHQKFKLGKDTYEVHINHIKGTVEPDQVTLSFPRPAKADVTFFGRKTNVRLRCNVSMEGSDFGLSLRHMGYSYRAGGTLTGKTPSLIGADGSIRLLINVEDR